MKFIKDILVIDFEGAGEPDHEPAQIGAVLLDKETLSEKDSFSSYIFANLRREADSTSGITQKMLDSAPTQAEVGKMVFEKFGTDFLIGSWVANFDIICFKKIMNAAGISWDQYDYHVLDIWPAVYIYLLKQGYTGGIRSEEIFQFFGAKPRGNHDALEDCRIASEVLRKITL